MSNRKQELADELDLPDVAEVICINGCPRSSCDGHIIRIDDGVEHTNDEYYCSSCQRVIFRCDGPICVKNDAETYTVNDIGVCKNCEQETEYTPPDEEELHTPPRHRQGKTEETD